MYEFEQNKRNNLILYGLNNEARETPELLMAKVQNIIRVTLAIRRDINLTKVDLEPTTSPRWGGCTPGPTSPAPAPSSSPSKSSRTGRR